jgi:cell wall-associated NlpC family hydrolase
MVRGQSTNGSEFDQKAVIKLRANTYKSFNYAAFLQDMATLSAARPNNATQRQALQAVAMSPKQSSEVLSRAVNVLGTPYRWGGSSPKKGFDCSGLIKYVYRDAAGISLPRSTREMIVMRAPTVDAKSLQSGDLVFFVGTYDTSGISHVGIYVGGNNFLHVSTSQGVKISSLLNSYWASKYWNARRI